MKYSEEFHQLIINNMMMGFAYCQVVTDPEDMPADYIFLDVNLAFENIIGQKRSDIIGKKATELHPWLKEFDWIGFYGHAAAFGLSVQREMHISGLDEWYLINVFSSEKGFFGVIFNEITELKRKERALITKNEEILKTQLKLRANHDMLAALYQEMAVSDVELRKQYDELQSKEETIRKLAYFDMLTALPNRVLFTERLNKAIENSLKNSLKLGVVFLDLDDFKKVNDTMGHFWGDELLKQVSKELESIVWKPDTLARFHGDEFTILLEEVDRLDAVDEIIERIKGVFLNPFIVNGTSCYLSASIGAAIFPDHGQSGEEILKNADIAMYKAKESGKNRHLFFREKMQHEMSKKLDLEQRLRFALQKNEFFLCYQPQTHVGTGKIRGCEALLRWKHPETGIIPPIDFIPIAEETGLIVPIGEWVLRTACKYAKQSWTDNLQGGIISVNISAVQLKHKDFVNLVKNVLEETGLDAQCLELEITESILIEGFVSIAQKLHELKMLGVRISLDDFGTGYSSLNYLRNLPLNTLKIDKAFIQDLKPDSYNRSIASSIISLVHRLNLEVIAEGVETKEQLAYLTQFNCDAVQGFYLHKPMLEHEVTNLVK